MKKKITITIIVLVLLSISFVIFSYNSRSSYVLMEDSEYWTPYYVVESLIPGPTVLVIAGIHGNEMAGIEAAETFLDYKINKGKLIMIPRANRIACEDGVRTPYYMQDLNRCFVGEEKGTQTEKLAWEISNIIHTYKVTAVIDLHESEGNYQQDEAYLGNSLIMSPYDKTPEVIMSIIEKINRDFEETDKFTYFHGSVKGSINQEISLYLDIPVITIETDITLPLEKRIYQHVYIIKSILNYFKMVN